MFKKIHIFRIKPNQDILAEIEKFCKKNRINSAIVISLIGSLKGAKLGFLKKLPADFSTKDFNGPLEIGSGTGTIALKDSELIIHIHLLVSDEKKSIAGHLIKGTVFSTAEVVLGELDFEIKRYHDKYTGLNELSSEFA